MLIVTVECMEEKKTKANEKKKTTDQNERYGGNATRSTVFFFAMCVCVYC